MQDQKTIEEFQKRNQKQRGFDTCSFALLQITQIWFSVFVRYFPVLMFKHGENGAALHSYVEQH